MKLAIRRRATLRVGLAAGLALALPAARACEFFTTHLRVYRPWSRATAAGDAFAVLGMSFDPVERPDRLIGVETPIATRAVLVGAGGGAGRAVDLPIPAGRATVLDEAGTCLRLLGLTQPLEVGRSYPLRLVFEHGGAIDADIDVDYERSV